MSEEVVGRDVLERRLIRAVDEGALAVTSISLFIYSRMMGEMGKERDDEQDEVYVVAEEGTHDEREYASGKGEQ